MESIGKFPLTSYHGAYANILPLPLPLCRLAASTPLWRRPAPPLLVVVSTSSSSSIVAVAGEARANVRANANGDRKLFKLSKH